VIEAWHVAEEAAKGQAVEAWHDNIQDGHRKLLRRQKLKRMLAIGSFGDSVAMLAEHCRDESPNSRHVICNQDARHHPLTLSPTGQLALP
jgi:hypothetical protein